MKVRKRRERAAAVAEGSSVLTNNRKMNLGALAVDHPGMQTTSPGTSAVVNLESSVQGFP